MILDEVIEMPLKPLGEMLIRDPKVADKLVIMHWQLEALEALESTPIVEDKINLAEFVADCNMVLGLHV